MLEVVPYEFRENSNLSFQHRLVVYHHVKKWWLRESGAILLSITASNIDLGCSLAGGHRALNISAFDLLDSVSPAVCDVIGLE